MDIYLKITAGFLISAILYIVISGFSKDISLLLTLFISAAAIIASMSYLKPVIDFMQSLIGHGMINREYLQIVCKIIGIGLISQISCLICSDAGNQSMCKVLQIITTVVILSISLPLLDEIMALINKILGEI
jgi:stage III sporulation protein AD